MTTPKTNKQDVDKVTGVETTGHEWDGIKELNNPLPRWWLNVFYACIVGSVIYWVLMPAWPGLPGIGGYTKGTLGFSDRANVSKDIAQLQAERAPLAAKLSGADLNTVEQDPELMQYAFAAGEAAFKDNCATCHGAGGQGVKGYPSLADDVWLWGGTLTDIRHTLEVGIRADHDETRYSQMPAFGRDGILSAQEISDVTDYVLNFSGNSDAGAEALSRGQEIYAVNCVSCHGDAGLGDRTQGAPNLADAEWVYGGSKAEVMTSISRGPFGVMPAWAGRLDSSTLDALAVYVHSRGGGE